MFKTACLKLLTKNELLERVKKITNWIELQTWTKNRGSAVSFSVKKAERRWARDEKGGF